MTSSETSRRRYRFSEHGASDYPECGRRQTRATAPQDPRPLTLAGIINRENLVRVFKQVRSRAGKGTGIDGYRYDDFSISEIGDAAEVIATAIHERRWRPAPSRRKWIPKPSGGQRALDIRCHIDRLASSAVTEALSGPLERIFLPTSFAYRPDRSVHKLLAILAHLIEQEGYFVVAQDDVSNAFPSVRINDVMQDYASVVEDPGLLHLIGVILRGHHQESLIGIEQGDPLSPLTLNLRLHHGQDLPSLATAGPDSPFRFRYADNAVYLCRNVTEGQCAIESDGALLQQAGFRFKGAGNHPVHLRRSGASTTVLGHRLRLDGGSVHFGLGNQALLKLSRALNRAHELPDSPTMAEAVVRGWIEEHGPVFENCGLQEVLRGVLQVAAANGFRELGSISRLTAWVDRAVTHWREVRRGSIDQLLPQILFLRAPRRRPAP